MIKNREYYDVKGKYYNLDDRIEITEYNTLISESLTDGSLRCMSGHRVASFMIDFKTAIWQALGRLFPDAVIKGCVFHLSQAVWRKVQNLGLSNAYKERKRVHSFISGVSLVFISGDI